MLKITVYESIDFCCRPTQNEFDAGLHNISTFILLEFGSHELTKKRSLITYILIFDLLYPHTSFTLTIFYQSQLLHNLV